MMGLKSNGGFFCLSKPDSTRAFLVLGLNEFASQPDKKPQRGSKKQTIGDTGGLFTDHFLNCGA